MPESANKPTYLNTHILGVRGAHQAFSAIDYDRLSLNKLTTRIVLYLAGKSQGRSNFVAHYNGLPRLLDQKIFLPSPIYQYNNEQYRQGEVPLEIIKGERPGCVEFSMITNSDNYPRMKLFVKEVIPIFFEAGYDHVNQNHSSIAWLHVGRNDPMETTVLSMQPDGLHIRDTNFSDGRVILTERDFEILRDLRM